MQRLQAYQFKLCPRGPQSQEMRQIAGSCRFVYNKGLALQKDSYETEGKKLSYAALCKELTAWRHHEETAFLAQAPTHPLQQSLRDLDRAYANFFAGRAGFPKFKRKGRRDSFRYPDPQQVKLDQANGRVFLPKLGWIKYRKSRQVEGEIKQITVRSIAGNWYMSVHTEREVEIEKHPASSMVGVDVGIAIFATLSDGTTFEPANSYRRQEEKLRRAQRQLARKQKFSANWRKQKQKVQRLHKKTADIRRDHLHKVSTTISKSHAIIVVEDLAVASMSKSARGNMNQPGKNVRAKAGLNKSILDQGWYEFRRQLEYKQTWRGGEVIAVAAHHTSQRCAVCEWVEADNRISQSRFSCRRCGHAENADVNAAKNIEAAGRAVIACRERPLGHSLKQEPTGSVA